MAEFWLRKKLSGDEKRRRKSKAKANPYSASGLEKFAALLEGIQAARGASLVERTASSISAARSISRSAQEWTTATLARSASRSKPLQCAAFETLALTPAAVPVVGNLENEVENSSEERGSQGSHDHAGVEEVISPEPVGVRLPVRTSRCRSMKVRSLHQQGWRQTSKSAFFVVVAMSAFMSSQFAKVGKPLASVLTVSAVIRIWRKGRVSARFLFSSVALYFLSPLRSYLVTCIPKRLSLKLISSVNATEDGAWHSEVEVAKQQQESTLGLPVTPLKSSVVVKDSAPLSILLPIPETSTSAQLPIGSLPVTVFRKSDGSTSSSRRLAMRISSKFKSLKIFKSSLSSTSSPLSLPSLSDSESSDATPEPTSPTLPSSPDRRRMCPFSRRLHKTKSSDVTDQLAQNDDSTSRKCIVMRRQRSSDGMVCKKSKLGRMLSSETLEQYNISESNSSSASSSLHGKSPSSSSDDAATGASKSRDDLSWPVVGLLVTLLFLLVGRFPAIMATSLFFVVVSNAHHDRAHGRERDTRALEAARKLQRSSPPRGQRWAATSPPRRF